MAVDVDTIAAIATPAGAGGIGIVKISGPQATCMVDVLVRPSKARPQHRSHHLYHGHVIDPETGKIVDEILYAIMKAPFSYTREDIVEIQAHGSRCGLHKILELVLRQGIRMAEPGEFTKRAFLNGRIDLAQAEAVAELITAHTSEGFELASEQLTGGLSKAIEAIRDSIKNLLMKVEAAIDFPEDLEDIIEDESCARTIDCHVLEPLQELLAHYDEGHVYREGIATIIIGRPNVGKSSLMNRLLHRQRAIVTTIPGTTRDFIEETVNINGIPMRLIDTAGLHHTHDALEVLGIELTRQRLDEANIVLFMVDCSVALTEEDETIFRMVKDRKTILVVNKTDLCPNQPVASIGNRFSELPYVAISALLNKGIDDLKKTIFTLVAAQRGPAELPDVVPNVRHKLALEQALRASKNARQGFTIRRPVELVAIDLREALDALGEVIGVTTTADILDGIFDQFCIGK